MHATRWREGHPRLSTGEYPVTTPKHEALGRIQFARMHGVSVGGEIIGRRQRVPLENGQLARPQSGVRQGTHAYGQVDALCDQIHIARHHADIQSDQGIRRSETSKQWQQLTLREVPSNADSDHACNGIVTRTHGIPGFLQALQ